MSAPVIKNNQAEKSAQFPIHSCKTITSFPLERNYSQMKVVLVSNCVNL